MELILGPLLLFNDSECIGDVIWVQKGRFNTNRQCRENDFRKNHLSNGWTWFSIAKYCRSIFNQPRQFRLFNFIATARKLTISAYHQMEDDRIYRFPIAISSLWRGIRDPFARNWWWNRHCCEKAILPPNSYLRLVTGQWIYRRLTIIQSEALGELWRWTGMALILRSSPIQLKHILSLFLAGRLMCEYCWSIKKMPQRRLHFQCRQPCDSFSKRIESSGTDSISERALSHWSPDGKKIAYFDFKTSYTELWIVDLLCPATAYLCDSTRRTNVFAIFVTMAPRQSNSVASPRISRTPLIA